MPNAPAKNTQVGTLLSDGNGSYYPVEFQGIRPGSMKVTATVTRGDVEYSTSFILRVTAELNVSIVSDPPVESITIYEGDTADDMIIALSDKRGQGKGDVDHEPGRQRCSCLLDTE